LKKNFKVGLLLSVICTCLIAQVDVQETFVKANRLYKEGGFETAYDMYKKIPDPSYQVLYNMGNCAYKLEKFGYALLHWRRAEKEAECFNRSELLDNILLLKRNLRKVKKEKGKFFEYFIRAKIYAISLVRAAPLFALQASFLLLWFFLFVYLRYLYKRKRKILISFLFILIALLGTVLVIRYRLEFKNYGIVVSKKAALLSGPGNNFQELGALSEASEVLIQKESDGFLKVKFYGQIGWASKKDVEKI